MAYAARWNFEMNRRNPYDPLCCLWSPMTRVRERERPWSSCRPLLSRCRALARRALFGRHLRWPSKLCGNGFLEPKNVWWGLWFLLSWEYGYRDPREHRDHSDHREHRDHKDQGDHKDQRVIGIIRSNGIIGIIGSIGIIRIKGIMRIKES